MTASRRENEWPKQVSYQDFDAKQPTQEEYEEQFQKWLSKKGQQVYSSPGVAEGAKEAAVAKGWETPVKGAFGIEFSNPIT